MLGSHVVAVLSSVQLILLEQAAKTLGDVLESIGAGITQVFHDIDRSFADISHRPGGGLRGLRFDSLQH